jgi:Mg-chelatase subunit ChlD
VKAQRKHIRLNSKQEQVMPMLINLKALDVTQDQLSKRAPIDLFCIIDRSGSMYGEKIELVKKTLHNLLEFTN